MKQDSSAFAFFGCHKNNHAATTSTKDFIAVALFCSLPKINLIGTPSVTMRENTELVEMHDMRDRRRLHACHPKHITVRTDVSLKTGGKFSECHNM